MTIVSIYNHCHDNAAQPASSRIEGSKTPQRNNADEIIVATTDLPEDKIIVEIAEKLQWPVELPDVADKGHEHAEGQLVVEDLPTAEIPHQENAEAHNEIEDSVEDEPRSLRHDHRFAKFVVTLVEAVLLPPFLREGLHHPDPGDRSGGW